MQAFSDNSFSIYKVAQSTLYAAIPNQFLRFIRQYAAEYQGLSTVPETLSVKGVIMNGLPGQSFQLSKDQPSQEIPINSLQFYNSMQ
jgi:hypothetical protein